MKRKVDWVAVCRRLLAAGLPVSDVADAMGVTVEALRRAVARKHLEPQS